MENITTSPNDEALTLEVSSEEEARALAASHWNVPVDGIVLTVVEESKSFLGLFGRKLKVEARRAAAPAPDVPAPAECEHESNFMTLLKRVISAAGLELEATEQSDGSVNLSGPDSRYLLAGRHGEGLKALDYIVNLMARNDGPAPRVRLDCEGFRRKREKDLERIAMEAAKEAMRTRRTVYLPPMSSWERRIVHLTLKESANVETHSIGVEPGRKVAVRLLGAGARREAFDERPRGERGERPEAPKSDAPRPRSGRPPRRRYNGPRRPRGGESAPTQE
ncbi:MAG: Jag N-terminal domain-containing protein [Pyramidobacter sp.]|nr:Jag N-terminal domain-containing protein [Pyramidobacter sp.]